jgi:hypothetical protein
LSGASFTFLPALSHRINLTMRYRSLVGKIMYYVTKIAPAAREVSQCIAGPTHEHWKAMERLVGYMKSHHLIYRKPRQLRVIGSADANYATNPDDRKSISGKIHTVEGMLTSWASNKQGLVTLSSAESVLNQASSPSRPTIPSPLKRWIMRCHRPPCWCPTY